MVEEGNKNYDSREDCNAIIETATNTLISGCQNTVIPNSVISIGNKAFDGCYYLRSITIPNSVKNIGEHAFYYCFALTSIEIPNSVTTIGVWAFSGCSSLKSISVAAGNTTYDSRNNCNAIIETTTNTLIAGCKNTVIPNSVTTIDEFAFYYCTSLTSITIPNSVTTIGQYAFYGCHNLRSITIPNSVTTIGQYAFYGCQYLKNITIGNRVTTIGEGAFYKCNISSITIPNSVTTIGDYAFNCCYHLKSITIGNRVTTIGEGAFNSCDSITSITSLIPAGKLFSIDSNVFKWVSKNACTLYVPYGAKETYEVTSGWNEFANIIELPATFDLTVSAAGYATLYLDYNAIIPNGVEVYTANTVKGDRLMLQQVNGVLPANTAAIVRAEQGTYTFTQSDEEVSAIENNLLRGSVEDEYITPKKGFAYYVLSMKNGIVGMYKDELTGGTFKNNANKAYLVLTDITVNDEEVDTQTPGVQLGNSYYFDFGGTTAIDKVVTGVNDNIYYDLSGRRVENPTRGIYIVNGKKRLIK